jgi:coenzyme F420-dependent glucose-6-phosphate dehydrogenase
VVAARRAAAGPLRQRVALARRRRPRASKISLGSAVTGLVHRYNPVVVAQQVATLEALYPGRAFLGIGTRRSTSRAATSGPRGRASTCKPSGGRPSAFGEQAARRLPPRGGGSGSRAGRGHPPGHGSRAESDEAALEGAREWKPTLVDEHYTDPVYDPAEIQANGREVSDTTFKMIGLISSDPDQHVRKIKAMQQPGATAIVLMNISGNDPEGTRRT